jgi:hypothetical protein
MKYNVLGAGLREEDLMTFRWNADVHTVHRKTGEYKILDNRGAYLGEIVKDGEDRYKIVFFGNVDREIREEIEKVKNVIGMITNRNVKSPEIRTGIFSRQIDHYQRNSLRYAA